MTAPPSRSSLSGTPSRATANAAFGQLYDWLTELLGGGSSTAAEKAAARASLQASRDLQPISASVASNALTLTLNPTSIDFRSATVGSGAINTRAVTSPITLVVSSGSTLGTTSGVQSRLAVLAIDNAGTVELAVVNAAGGLSLDESGVISTTAEGGSGAADSVSTIYSAAARSNVPYRFVGFIESTQATAGNWATAPSKVQGAGGQALPFSQMLGIGQTWQVLTGSRTSGTNYTNTTGRPIFVLVGTNNTNGTTIVIAGSTVVALPTSPSNGSHGFVVPAGATYSVTASSGISVWSELR